MSDVWTKWEGRLVNGVYPLRRFLGNSDHSVVFLTEYRPLEVGDAAIKLVPADPQLATGQLARWRTFRSLSHPHLLRLFDSGHCQLGGHPFFFVVMEYADQTLAQVLPQRPLTSEEVRELLPPTLDALEFLHRKDLVQGQLKPANVLVVGDQVKLASDTIRPAGDPLPKNHTLSAYDAPEVHDARSSTAGDIWGLGITLVQALTQASPETAGAPLASVPLPSTLAQPFADTIRRCLSLDPALRPSVADLRAALAAHPTPARADRATALPAPRFEIEKLKHPAVIAAGIVLVILLGWLALRGPGHPSADRPPDAASTPASATSPAVSPAPAARGANGGGGAAAAPSVVHQQIPTVSRSAQASIQGRLKVSVRVNVDRAGNVVAATLQDPGPSKYFSRLAVDAAKQWKFSPTDSPRVWTLQFAFSREKVTAQASPKT
ncbi:MAG: TonB family protein [Proteobacteria bacterium]|nr:TonB family protein [Pseudomonadota bacterium]